MTVLSLKPQKASVLAHTRGVRARLYACVHVAILSNAPRELQSRVFKYVRGG